MFNKMQFQGGTPSWVAPVARWSLWDARMQPGGAPSSAELSFVEPMLRRRLSQLARVSLKVAHDCVHDLPSVRVVYASRHGELNRTTAMLQDLAANEALSPTAFSMSVLNASVGLFSIIRNDTAPATAISSGGESFGYGLLEACLQLASHPLQPVLFIFADEPLPEIYGRCKPDDDCTHAIAMLLQNDAAATTIACAIAPSETEGSAETQSRAFLRCLEPGQVGVEWHGAGASWSWSRQAQ